MTSNALLLAILHANLHTVDMNKESAVRVLNTVISSGVTRVMIAKRLNIHPSQVSRVANGYFKRLDGHALRICKFAQFLAARDQLNSGPPSASLELEGKLRRLMLINPGAAEALSEMLDALVETQG